MPDNQPEASNQTTPSTTEVIFTNVTTESTPNTTQVIFTNATTESTPNTTQVIFTNFTTEYNTTTTEDAGDTPRYYLIIGLVVVCYILGVISLLYNVCCKKKKKPKKKGIAMEKIPTVSPLDLTQREKQVTDTDLEMKVRRQRALIEEMQSKKNTTSALGSVSWILNAGSSSGGNLGAPASRSAGLLATKDINVTVNPSDIPPVLRNMGVRGVHIEDPKPEPKKAAEMSYGEELLASLRKAMAESEAAEQERHRGSLGTNAKRFVPRQ